MKQDKGNQPEQDKQVEKRYEAPAVIYEGAISTRAGSPLGNPTGSDDIDPADLFGE